MNEHEAERIAAAINILRPDWPRKSLVTLIMTKLAHRPRRDVCVALAWVACESNSHTPARVVEGGPWWKAAAADDGSGTSRMRYPAKAGSPDECRIHPGEHADHCRSCAGDRLAGDITPPKPREGTPPPEGWRQARAAMRSEG